MNIAFIARKLRLPRFWPDSRIRVAVLGNSHLSALKMAERKGLVDTDDFDLCFYGGVGKFFWNMTLTDGILDMGNKEKARLVTDGRFERLPLDQFDAVLFHGGSIHHGMFLKRFAEAGLSPNRVSSAFLLETARQVLNLHGKTRTLLKRVNQHVNVPVMVSPTPLKARFSNLFAETCVADTEIAQLNRVLEIATREEGIHFLPQPPSTIVDHIYTQDHFSVGSVRLGGDMTVKHAEDDFGHMNAEYGALVLDQALASFRDLLSADHLSPRRFARLEKRRAG